MITLRTTTAAIGFTAIFVLASHAHAGADSTDSAPAESHHRGLPVLVDIHIATPSKAEESPGKSAKKLAKKSAKKPAKKSARKATRAARASELRGRGARPVALAPRSSQGPGDRVAERSPGPAATREPRSGLAPRMITRVIRGNLDEIEHCASRGGSRGEMILEFTVTPKGRTRDVAIAASGGELAAIRRCVARRIRGWRFPTARTPSRVTYPLSFTVAGS